jgi:hypothetical protein
MPKTLKPHRAATARAIDAPVPDETPMTMAHGRCYDMSRLLPPEALGRHPGLPGRAIEQRLHGPGRLPVQRQQPRFVIRVDGAVRIEVDAGSDELPDPERIR